MVSLKVCVLLVALFLLSFSVCFSQANRGRIQIQGKNIEKSESWAQDANFTKSQAVEKLEDLWRGLSSAQKKERRVAYKKAKSYILNSPSKGRCRTNKKISKTFQDPQRKDLKARIDIEIITGCAFVN